VRELVETFGFVSGDLKLLSGGRDQNVSVPLSVFFLKI
jgi:hypothetical protein